ncbi:MAG: DinB family protein [Gemmatimonadaceae bacterium]|nr:DinB family protein [Gemmatimonadaceae bacterium]
MPISRVDRLASILRTEAATTRRHLERVPDEQFGWRPHAKSSALGQLSAHFIDCLNFAHAIFREDVTAIDMATWRPTKVASLAELLAMFDGALETALTAMATHPDRDASGTWQMSVNGMVRISRDREAAFNDMTLHHLIHHRGQLTVYLRLLDVPVAPTYGPTADERM